MTPQLAMWLRKTQTQNELDMHADTSCSSAKYIWLYSSSREPILIAYDTVQAKDKYKERREKGKEEKKDSDRERNRKKESDKASERVKVRKRKKERERKKSDSMGIDYLLVDD